jgi:fumarate hydratase, class II
MTRQTYRVEKDSMGEVQVPADALYAAQTQRAVENFPVSGLPMPRAMIRSLGLIKAACAAANAELGLMENSMADAIQAAAQEVAEGHHDYHFPIDIFQTGSGTSSNMNANEVIANLASTHLGNKVHPNDHVNMGQSSNDVIPTAIHVSGCLLAHEMLLPALQHLADTIAKRRPELTDVVTTGRTHLMDAMPVTLAQELSGWESQVRLGAARRSRCTKTPVGAGPGRNRGWHRHQCASGVRPRVAANLAGMTGIAFFRRDNSSKALSSQDTAVELSGQLKTTAVSLMKIANDLRWMNSGPLAGLG